MRSGRGRPLAEVVRSWAMSLLRTRDIGPNTLIALAEDPSTTGGAFVWGDPNHLLLKKGDVVQALELHETRDSDWAKLLVLVVKGRRAGRVGYVSVDMGRRTQRCWQSLTATGSMSPVRLQVKTPQERETVGLAVLVKKP